MLDVRLLSFAGFEVPQLAVAGVTGLLPRFSPQRLGHGVVYTFGSAAGAKEYTIDQVVMQVRELAGSGSFSVPLLTGTQENPGGEANAQIATVKELFVFYYPRSADGTVAATDVTVALDTQLAAALGYAAAVSKVIKPGQAWSDSRSKGGTIASGTGTITVTNAAGTKATVCVAAAGWKP